MRNAGVGAKVSMQSSKPKHRDGLDDVIVYSGSVIEVTMFIFS